MEKKLDILYAEDHLETAARFAREMEAYGFRVRTVHNGEAALRAFGEKRPNAVVLDYRMPGISGLEAAEAIRRTDAQVPILILSSYTEYAAATLKNGCADFIRKDSSTEEICLRIERAWHASQGTLPASEPAAADEVYYLNESSWYNASTFTLYVDEKPVPLSGMPGQFLAKLCRQQNHFVTAEELCKILWGVYNKGKQKQLHDYASRLRKMLEAIPEVALRSVPGKGFQLQTIDY